MTLPIITNVTRYEQSDGLTTIFFQCNMYDGRGILDRTFQINNYELYWYYSQLGWSLRYSPFKEFWSESTEQVRRDYLFLFISDENSWVCQGAKVKVRDEQRTVKTAQIKSYKWAS